MQISIDNLYTVLYNIIKIRINSREVITIDKEKPPPFLVCKDVQELLQCSPATAYRIMRKLNKELEAKGYITLSGRVSRKYFYERLFV